MTDTKQAKRSPVASTTDGTFVGDIVAWEFANDDGFSARRSDVDTIFTRHGFKDCIDFDKGSAQSALLRAPKAGGVKKGRGIVIEPMDLKRKDTVASLAVYVKESKTGESGDEWKAGARVRINPQTGLANARPMEGQSAADVDVRCYEIAEALAAKANELMTNVTNKELSGAVTNAGTKLFWAPYRRKCGGVYYIPASSAQRFRDLLDDLETLGGFWPTIQPLFTDSGDRTMKNVTTATQFALEKELEKLTADLDKLTESGMRQSAIDARIAKCQEVVIRANLYRTVLDKTSDDLKLKVEHIRDKFKGALKVDGAVFDGVDAEIAEADKRSKGKGRRRSRKAATKTEAPTTETATEENLSDTNLFDVAVEG